jgi:hypothetical protein
VAIRPRCMGARPSTAAPFQSLRDVTIVPRPKPASVHRSIPSQLLRPIAQATPSRRATSGNRGAGLRTWPTDLARAFTAPVAGASGSVPAPTMSKSREWQQALHVMSSATAAPSQEKANAAIYWSASAAKNRLVRDPTRAMALAQLSLGLRASRRISHSYCCRCERWMPMRADRPLCVCVGRLERSKDVDLGSLQSLGAFLVRPQDPVAERIPQQRRRSLRFLNCALRTAIAVAARMAARSREAMGC